MRLFAVIDKCINYLDGLNFYIKFSIIYILGHFGFLCILDAYWWDDWCWINASSQTIVNEFSEYGVPIFGYFQVFNFNLNPVISRLFTFSVFYAISIVLYKISMDYKWLNESKRQQVIVLFAIVPLNIAKVSLVNSQYTACLLLFFIAWYLIDKNLFSAVILFSLSFLTQSLIVFFILPFTDMLLTRKLKIPQLTMFAFLPVIMFFIKQIYFQPYGKYLGTHKITLSIKKVLKVYYYTFEDFLNYLNDIRFGLIVFVFIILILTIVRNVNGYSIVSKKREGIIFLVLGCCALFFAILPYAVGKYVPRFYEWDSRHQILMPLGVALVLVWFVNLTQIKGVYQLMVISLCFINNKNYFELRQDWNQQKIIIDKISRINQNNGYTVFLFRNKLNWAIKRGLRFYEYSGWIKESLRSDSCFGLQYESFKEFQKGDYDGFFTDAYNSKNFVRNNDNSIIIVDLNYSNGNRDSINVEFTSHESGRRIDYGL